MDDFHIYEEIGQGKHSTVYKGRRKSSIVYVAIGSVTFRVDGPCPRCTVPDVNQDTGRPDSAAVGPMKSLRAYRARAGTGVLFGAYLSPVMQGVVSPGQPVTVTYC